MLDLMQVKQKIVENRKVRSCFSLRARRGGQKTFSHQNYRYYNVFEKGT